MSGSKNELIGFARIVADALFIESSRVQPESKIGTSEAISGDTVSYRDEFTSGRLLK
jgi:hypothetical protein